MACYFTPTFFRHTIDVDMKIFAWRKSKLFYAYSLEKERNMKNMKNGERAQAKLASTVDSDTYQNHESYHHEIHKAFQIS